MEYTTIKEQFFYLTRLENKSYKEACEELNVDRKLTVQWDKEFLTERNEEIKKINRVRGLYKSKKLKDNFLFSKTSCHEFYNWYVQTYNKQSGNCFYCGTNENTLRKIVQAGLFKSKRIRGMHLEVERRNPISNEYSPENCVLACHFCNNHKSDIISEVQHKTYFAPAIKKFVDDIYNELKIAQQL